MPVRVLVGAQWGDEGKGKVVDYLSKDFRVVARYAGGPNAGHTVVVAGVKTILHHIPSGILRPDGLCLLGNGVVIDPVILKEEIRGLEAGGVSCTGRILISRRAHIILSTHRLLDSLCEKARGARAIGTTGKGIGPAYGDKVLRRGVRAHELLERDALTARLRAEIREFNRTVQAVYEHEGLDVDEVIAEALAAGDTLKPMLADTGTLLRERLHKGASILLEGAQGTLLDLDHGTYPYATSSSATAGGAAIGCGIGPTAIDDVWGVAKAYFTRVGNGPFPTELTGAEGDAMREAGKEYGSTTGRPRRCGWFDGVAARYATEVNGLRALAITKLDVLTGIDPLRVCVAYEIDGERTEEFPESADALARAKPVYEELPGWSDPLRGVRSPEELPAATRAYLDRLVDLSCCAIALVSVGPGREETVSGFAGMALTRGGR
jgi:adenylosuccinate synthase